MRSSVGALLCVACLAGAGGFAAPLRAEDAPAVLPWLSQSLSGSPRPDPRPSEGVAPPAPTLSVSVGRVEAIDRDAAGLIPAALAGLSPDMWLGGNSDRAIAMLDRLTPSHLPGAQDLLYRLVLSEATPPDRRDDSLLLARIDALLRRGALERAQALIERAGPETRELFRRWFDISLLTRSEDRACAALAANPMLAPSVATRVFCLARAGRWTTAALTLESAAALGDVSAADYDLLARFLDPDLFEGEPSLPRPQQATPLRFRLYEAIGEPLPTRDLPLAFVWSDLSFTAGWKAQLDAGERLARSGAVPGNRLLGLYTERRTTVSGAIWDRVRAVQALDLALNSGDTAAVGTALEHASQVMAAADLEPALARMMAPRLGRLTLVGPGAVEAARLSLLVGQVPGPLPAAAPAAMVLATAILAGQDVPEPDTDLGRTVSQAFVGAEPPLVDGQGEAILAALTLLAPGAEADMQDWGNALRLLRGAGQEESARRIAADMLMYGGTH